MTLDRPAQAQIGAGILLLLASLFALYRWHYTPAANAAVGLETLSDMLRIEANHPAASQPLTGVMAAPLLGRLAERMRHHIGLVAPTALLLLGDQASRALISTEGTETGKNLPFVNHSDGIVPAASVAHPRVMLGQPSAKAEAWRALQGLAKGWGQ